MAEKKVLLDTNFLMLPGTSHLNIFSEIDRVMSDNYVMIVLEPVLDELERIASSENGDVKEEDRRAAKLGRVLVEQKSEENPSFLKKIFSSNTDKRKVLKIVGGSSTKTEGSGDADSAILEFSDENTIVATQDKELKKKLKKKNKNIRFIEARQRNHLVLR